MLKFISTTAIEVHCSLSVDRNQLCEVGVFIENVPGHPKIEGVDLHQFFFNMIHVLHIHSSITTYIAANCYVQEG